MIMIIAIEIDTADTVCSRQEFKSASLDHHGDRRCNEIF
jgi:hypothetical protein